MKVWKVTEGDGGSCPLYIDRMVVWDEIADLECEEIGNKYLIEVVDMSEDIFFNLPEWGGF